MEVAKQMRSDAGSVEEQLDMLLRLERLEDFEERLIDANCNLLTRIISYCEKNSIPFDNGLRVLLSEARKALKYPAVEKSSSPDLKRFRKSPEDGTEPIVFSAS